MVVNVPTEVIRKNNLEVKHFFDILKPTAEKSKSRIRIRVVKIRGSGSASKHHESETLVTKKTSRTRGPKTRAWRQET
jgi:hypothetical protein